MCVPPDEILKYQAYVSSVARSLLSDEHSAEDLAQRTLLYALERPPHSKQAVRSWLYLVLRNLAINAHKSRQRRLDHEILAARPATFREPDRAAEKECRARIRTLVESMDDPYRTVISLYYLESLGTREIANALSVPVSTIKTRLRRGRGLLTRAAKRLRPCS